MKKVLLFGAGKAATTLIHFMGKYCASHNHEFLVCDQDLKTAQSKITGYATSRAVSIDVTNEEQRQDIVSGADLVISLLPPALHILVAKDCLRFYKDLLTASYIDPQLHELAAEIKRRDILFLSEMGLDPGIDHMSAMRIFDRLRNEGALIKSFYSHCGGLMTPESDDNPWHYKITWNPMNVVRAGSAGARFLLYGKEETVEYSDIFSRTDQTIQLEKIGPLAWYPNRDSISYLNTYGLEGVDTFIRTTLRYPAYNRAWNLIVHLGLTCTGDQDQLQGCNTVTDWYHKKVKAFKENNPDSKLMPLLSDSNIEAQFRYLGLYDDSPLPPANSSAEVMLSLLVNHLVMKQEDKDMIVMVHEIEYEIAHTRKKITSTLIVEGDDSLNTAMAKTVGAPLAIGASLILEGKITATGLHIPVIPEIYEPILERLAQNGIAFAEKEETTG